MHLKVVCHPPLKHQEEEEGAGRGAPSTLEIHSRDSTRPSAAHQSFRTQCMRRGEQFTACRIFT